MDGRQDSGVAGIGKDMRPAGCRQLVVKPADARQTAAQHYHLRVEDVDDAGQRTRQSCDVTGQAGVAGRVTGIGGAGNGGGIERGAALASMVGGQPGTG